MRKFILLSLLAFVLFYESKATHIIGGEVTYQFIQVNSNNTFRYRINLNLYLNYYAQSGLDCGEQQIQLGVYNAANDQLFTISNANRISCSEATLPLPSGCNIPNLPRVNLSRYTTIIDLPISFSGYHITYQRCCKIGNILNLTNSGAQGNTYYTFIPASIYKNNSPVFSNLAVPAICISDTVTLNNNAVDADGDRLIFEFVKPYQGGSTSDPVPTPVNPFQALDDCDYNNGFSETQPFGSNGYAYINPSTGISRYYCSVQGTYLVGINVKEYRDINGVQTLISSTRRDVQLYVSGQCPANATPVGTTNNTITSSSVTFDIEEGQALCFNLKGTDANNDSVKISAVSNILDGTNGYTGTLATFPPVRGLGTATTQFCWDTDCGKPGTYFVNARVEDVGCPPKATSITYQINVNPFRAPNTIDGPEVICLNSTSSYVYSVAPQTSSSYNWQTTGGTIVSSTNNDSLTIRFTSTGTYTIKFKETSQYGCIDSVTKVVNVIQGAQINAGTDANICKGSSTTLTAQNSSFSSYLWTPTTGLSDPTVGNPVANPAVTTTYIVRGTDANTGCQTFDTVKVNVVNAVANAGADKNFCTGTTGTPTQIGTAAVSGLTYLWTPSIGLSNPNVPRPFVTYQNNSTSDTTITYVVQSTSTFLGCINTDTVRVTIKRGPIINAGTDGNICSGDTIQVGSATETNHTYSWAQPTNGGLSATNISNPTINTTNETNAPVINNYILTTTINGCSKVDTVKIQIYPSLKNVNAGADQTICFGTTANLGNSGASNQTYIWSPTIALSNSGVSNPVFNYTNNPTVDTTITYVIEVSNAFACKKYDTVKVVLKQRPLANAGANVSICSGDVTTIGGSSEANVTYSWASTTGLSTPNASTTNVTLTNTTNNPTNTNYIVTSNLNGCTHKDTVTVQTYPSLKNVNAGADQTICFGTTANLGNGGASNQTYIWSPTIALSNSGISNPVFNYTNNPTVDTTITYVVEVSNAYACKKYDTVKVVLKQRPLANAGTNVNICSGDVATIGGSSETNVTYSWASTTGLSSPNSSTTNVTLTNATNNPINTNYIVTSNLNGCTHKDTVTVQTYPSLKNVNAGADQTICFGTTANLGNGGASNQTYIWSPTIALSNSGVSNPVFNYTNNPTVDTTITYVVEVSNAYACKKYDTVKVVLKQRPIALAGSDVNICSGDTTTIGGASETNTTYNWTGGTVLSPNSNTTLVSLTNNGNDPINTNFIVTATLNGCIHRDTVKVQTYPSLKQVSAGTDQTICFGTTANLGNGGASNQTYIWSPTIALSNSGISNPVFNYTNNPTVDTTITYVVEVSNAYACKKYDTVKVVLKQRPIALAGNDISFCSGDTVQLGTSNQTSFVYSWTSTNGLNNSSVSDPLLTLTNTDTIPDTLAYIVTTDLTGCIDSDTVKIVVFPTPTAVSLTGSQNVCPGVTDIYYWFSTYNPNSTYQWLIDGGFITSVNEDSIVVNWGTTQTTAFIALIETTEYQCKNDQDTLKIYVRINPKLKPVLPTPDEDLCLNAAVAIDYSTLLTNGSTYTWGINGGVINNINNNIVNVTWNTVGETSLWVIESVTADTVCSGVSDTLSLMIFPSPLADAGADVSICSGESVTIGANNNSTYTYEWLQTNGISNNTISNPIVTLENNSNNPDSLYYIVKANLNTCPDYDTVRVVVYPSLKNVSAGDDITLCSGFEQTIGTSASAGQTYTWNTEINLSDSTTANPVFSSVNLTQNVIQLQYVLTVKNDFNCDATDTIVVKLKSAPLPDAGADVSFCSGSSSNLGTNSNSSYTYLWNNSNGLNSNSIANPSITLDNNNSIPDTIYYSVLVDLDGCSDSDTVQVVVFPALKAINAGPDSALCAGSTIVLGPSQVISNQNYNWIPANNLNNSAIANPILDSVNTSGSNINLEYVLEVDNGFGCKATDTIVVTLKPQLRALNLAGNMVLCQFATNENYTVQGLNGSTYNWQLNGSNLGIDTNNVILNWDTSGTYTLQVIETNQGCVGVPFVFNILINPKPEKPSITGISTICPQNSTGFVYTATGLAGSNFIWDIKGGTITNTSTFADTVVVNWNTNTVNEISVSENSSENCKSDATVKPIVYDGSNVDMYVVTTKKENENIIDLSWKLNNLENYPNQVTLLRREISPSLKSWETLATLPKTDTSYSDGPLATDNVQYEYKIVGINNCGDSLITLLHNSILLKVANNEENETTVLDFTSYKNWRNDVKEYQIWRKLDSENDFQMYRTLNNSTTSAEFRNAEDGFSHCYRIVAIEEQGNNRISYSNEVCIEFKHKLYIPNIFTPNGDGINDTWNIENINMYPKNTISIYNRWGTKAIDFESYRNTWDGGGLSEGIYFFILNLNNGDEPVKGWVQIMK